MNTQTPASPTVSPPRPSGLPLRRVRGWVVWLVAGCWLAAGTLLADPAVTPPGPERPSVEELRARLQGILSRPEYQWPDQPENDWRLQLLRRLYQWWHEQVTPRISHLYEYSPVAYWLLVAVLMAACVLLIYHIYISLRSAFGPGGRGRAGQRGTVEPVVEGSPEALLAEADEAAAQRHYRRALRCLYLAVIRHLERRRLLRYDPSRSNGEYLRDLRPHPRLQALLRSVTDLVDAVWYGGQRAGAEEYERCRQWALSAWQEGGEAP